MGIVARRFKELRMTLGELDRIIDLGFGQPSSTGVMVNTDQAMRVSAVFGCVRIISETSASLPFGVYRNVDGGGKESLSNHPLYELLHYSPNPEMTAIEFREAMAGHMALRGVAYADVVRNGAGDPIALWPLRPDRMVEIRRNPGNQQLEYVYQLPSGERRILDAYNVLHLKGFGDGVGGYNIISMAREAIGLAAASEQYGAQFFGNGARPSGVLEHPGPLKPGSKENIRESWEKMHKGLTNAHRVAVLEEGMKYHQISLSPEDAQFLQIRKFQIADIARFYRIPLHMLQELDRATFSNIEHQSLEFAIFTLVPWLVRLEQGMRRCLLTTSDKRKGLYVSHTVNGLVRGDIKTRYEAYAVGRQWGWLSSDDIRELEDLNPIPDGKGKIYLQPLNMVEAGTVVEPKTQEPAPGPPEGIRSLDVRHTGTAPGETRAMRSATTRRRLATSYRRMVDDAATRVIKREKADIMRQAEKMLTRRGVPDFLRWLDDFYREHASFVEQNMGPVFHSIAEASSAEAADEINMTHSIDLEMQAFMTAYVATYVARHIEQSKGQLRAVVIDADTGGDDVIAALAKRLQEWEERRGGKIAMWETIRASNAAALETYRQGGIKKKVWHNFNPSCPYCREMDGKVVGIEEAFLGADTAFHPEGADHTLVNTHDCGHAPLHEGCDCQIGPAY